MGPQSTCVTMECPFAAFCKHYNFLIDRSKGCEHQEKILKAAEKYKKDKEVKK